MDEGQNRRKLYLFTDSYPWGKGEKSLIEPELKFLAENFDVTIVSAAPDENLRDKENESDVEAGINVLHWNNPSKIKLLKLALGFPFSKIGRKEIRRIMEDGFSLGRLADSAKSFARSSSLRNFCKSNHIFEDDDAIFYSFWFNELTLALVRESKVRDISVLSRINGYELFNARNSHGRQPFQWFKRDEIKSLIFASSNARDAFIAEFGEPVKEGQFFVNRLGVSRHEQIHLSRNSEKALLVSCSNVIPLKRVDLIAKAIAASSNKNRIRWIHFGGGSSLEEIKSLSDQLGIDAEFAGAVPNPEIIEFYENNYVDAVILLSETEGGCPVCLQEAMSFGIPLIGTDVGGISEEIDGNGTLLGFQPSIEEITKAIDEVCFASEVNRDKMSKRSLEIYRDRFDVYKNKADLKNYFELQGYL